MRTRLESSFNRDLRRIRDPSLLNRVNQKIAEIKAAPNLRSIPGVRRVNAPSGNHYRIRIGRYRLGVTVDGDVAVIVAFGHRSDIYRRFP
ncbi:MAG: type II toxin-antitoxin system RelE/ParE family toxin [Chloroflexota bacterium]|nr:type II toxin-antitoxin system RelE/ParE family toxin [Chloroflexota bacterium]MDE2686661.1 type II toxin-antitoxin system RelE/ParE family toxin [Chloroflexota bacterium]